MRSTMSAFPSVRSRYCLHEAGINPEQLDYVGFYEQPLTKFERLIETYVNYAPKGFTSYPTGDADLVAGEAHLPKIIRQGLGGQYSGRIVFRATTRSHAASAFFPSPYEEAAILTLDGVGEWSTTPSVTAAAIRSSSSREMQFPHSLGLLYSAFTYYCGFKVNSGEYKLMGLAPYGEPGYADLIYEHLMDLKPDGSFRMDMEYFNYCQGLTMTGPKFDELFGGPPRKPDSRLEQRHMDLAASIQAVCRRGDATDGPATHGSGPGVDEPRHGRRRGAQLRRPTAGCCGRAHSRISGSSRRPATPAARSARRCSYGISSSDKPRKWFGSRHAEGFPPRPVVFDVDEARLLHDVGARYHRFDDEAPAADGRRAGHGRRAGRRVVPRPHGVRAARAGRAKHHRRRPQSRRCRAR